MWDQFQGDKDLCSDSEESEVICGVELLEHGLGLVHEVVEKAAVLHRGGIVQRGLDGHAVRVNHDRADHTLKLKLSTEFPTRIL